MPGRTLNANTGARRIDPRPADSFKRRNSTDANKSFYHSSRWRKTRRAFKEQQRKKDLSIAQRVHAHSDKSTLDQYNRWVASGQCLCVHCAEEGILRQGRICDHIHRMRDGGSPYDFDNLQMLCSYHHNIKSGKEAHE